MSNLAETKATARKTLHDAMCVSAFYSDAVVTPPKELCVRWHSKIQRRGDLDGQGWAEVIEGIDRIIFEDAELAAKGITLTRGGSISIVVYGGANFTLEAQEPRDGPVTISWSVVRA